MKDMIIRNASVDDAEALLNIYAYYVENEYYGKVKNFVEFIKNKGI